MKLSIFMKNLVCLWKVLFRKCLLYVFVIYEMSKNNKNVELVNDIYVYFMLI